MIMPTLIALGLYIFLRADNEIDDLLRPFQGPALSVIEFFMVVLAIASGIVVWEGVKTLAFWFFGNLLF